MQNDSYTLARHEDRESTYVIIIGDNGPYIAHSGTKGMKWGQRLYQYLNGALTPLGREHYGVGPPRGSKSEAESKPKDATSSNPDPAKKLGNSIKINGKDASTIKSGIQAKIKEVQDKHRENAVKRAEIKEVERKEKEDKKEAEKLAKEAKEEAERKAIEEMEQDRERARVNALKEYYREHPLQIYSARNLLSEEDIKDVQKKIELDRKLKDFRRDELLRYVRTANDVVNTLDTAVKAGKDLKDLYNLGAETYNSLIAAKDPNDDKKPMRLIGNDKYIPKKPTDASTDKKNGQKQDSQQQNNSSDTDQSGGKKNKNKKAPDSQKDNPTMEQAGKEMKDTEKKSSTSPEAERVKKAYNDLAKNVETKSKSNSIKPDYIGKVELKNGTTRYFYDQDEYDAYREIRKPGGVAEKSINMFKKSSDASQFKEFNKSMGDIMKKKVSEGTWTNEMQGKRDALYDAIRDYTEENGPIVSPPKFPENTSRLGPTGEFKPLNQRQAVENIAKDRKRMQELYKKYG